MVGEWSASRTSGTEKPGRSIEQATSPMFFVRVCRFRVPSFDKVVILNFYPGDDSCVT